MPAMSESGKLSQEEFEAVFMFFDKRGNGLISFDEFVKTVRGKMNEPRLKLVQKAFHALDAAGDGSKISCLQQALWGKCEFSFMRDCNASCGRCDSQPRRRALRRTRLVRARQGLARGQRHPVH